MSDDAHFALRSNADLRKQMWVADLHAFTRFAGAMAAFDWPVALAAVGAGLGETGLSIDEAINGHTTAERQAGVIGAVLASIDTLFNATLLGEETGEAIRIDSEVPAVAEPYVEAEDEPLATAEDIDAQVPVPCDRHRLPSAWPPSRPMPCSMAKNPGLARCRASTRWPTVSM
ncbi:hypothetical protein NWF32_30865 [Pseudomonas qingdaonensis]|nr:hypothetical protein [Pseudomonas qingdaonensis]